MNETPHDRQSPAGGRSADSDDLDRLSKRVSVALEHDARRRRWSSRLFFGIALLPLLAAGAVLIFGHSDAQRAELLIERQSRAIENAVSTRVSNSMQADLERLRGLGATLPEPGLVDQLRTEVRDNDAALAAMTEQLQSALQQQRTLQQSMARADAGLAQRIDALSERTQAPESPDRATLAALDSKLDALAERQRVDSTALSARLSRMTGPSTDPALLQQAVERLTRQLGVMDTRLQALERRLAGDGRTSAPDSGRLQADINQLTRSLSLQLSSLERRITALERRR